MYKSTDETLYDAVKEHLAKGEDPNFESPYRETPLNQAFRRGRMDVFSLLLDHGADLSDTHWGPLHKAVALASLKDVQCAAGTGDMSARDVSGLTPFLLACDIGDVEKAAFLLPLSGQEDVVSATRDRQPALTVAAKKGRAGIVSWLLANGFDVNEPDVYGGTALIAAAEVDEVEIVKILLEASADIGAAYNLSKAVDDMDNSDLDPDIEDLLQGQAEHFQTAVSETRSAKVARLLIETGAKPHEFSNCVLNDLTGAALIQEQQITPAIFEAQKHRRFGTRNPEPVAFEFWLEMVRTGESGSWAHRDFGKGERDYSGPAIWSFDRFGISTTELSNDVWVQIAGQHEDSYDVDFCIYNDVIVHDGNGNTHIYTYPCEVFPPTDVHTATLVEDAIIIIGNLGYEENRQVGQTQVMRLNLKDLSINEIKTTGSSPGWISRHQAQLDGDKIIVWGGEAWDGSDFVSMDGAYELSLATGIWQKLDRA